MLAALGPKTQELAGRDFDGVLLHSHWTDQAVADCVDRVRVAGREGRARPGRAGVVVPGDRLRSARAGELRHVVRRMTTYMQIPGYGELIVDANGWDRAVLDRLRGHQLLQGRLPTRRSSA